MRAKVPPVLRSELKTVHERFGRWRETKQGRERIPERLWRAAVKLCADYSMNTVAEVLRVNHTELKKRADATGNDGASGEIFQPTFVEVDLHQRTPSGECVVELEDRRGAKMTIRVRGSSTLDVVGLSKAFWNRQR